MDKMIFERAAQSIAVLLALAGVASVALLTLNALMVLGELSRIFLSFVGLA